MFKKLPNILTSFCGKNVGETFPKNFQFEPTILHLPNGLYSRRNSHQNCSYLNISIQ